MNLVLNKKWIAHLNEIDDSEFRVVDILLTDMSTMTKIVITDNVVHIPRNAILSNSDILNIKLHKTRL